MDKPLLELKNATVWRGDDCIFRDFSLEFNLGESVAILGPNGAGKSTLVQLLTGGLRVQALPDTVCKVFGEANYALDDLRKKIGVVTAGDLPLLDLSQRVEDLVLLAFRGAYGFTQQMIFTEQEFQETSHILDQLNIDHLRKRELRALSSGEKQRVLLARAMVHRPKVLIFDEPTVGLDFASSLRFLKIISEVIQQGKTVLLITHHPSEIPPEVSRCVLLKGGKVFSDGVKEEMMTSSVLTDLYDVELEVEFNSGWCGIRPA